MFDPGGMNNSSFSHASRLDPLEQRKNIYDKIKRQTNLEIDQQIKYEGRIKIWLGAFVASEHMRLKKMTGAYFFLSEQLL